MKFRFHRGGFEESTATMVEVHSMEELRAAIEREYLLPILGDLEFRFAGYDDRIKWHTFNVIGSIYIDAPHVLGQSDGNTFIA